MECHETRKPKLPKGLSKLHLQVMQTIRAKELIRPQASVLIAVSGGQDSVCLAQLMVDLSRAKAWKLQVVPPHLRLQCGVSSEQALDRSFSLLCTICDSAGGPLRPPVA